MTRRRVAIGLDWLILAVLLVAIGIELTGGFYTQVAGLRISARSVDRAALALLVLVLIRRRVTREVGALGFDPARIQRLRQRTFNRGADPDPAAPRAAPRRQTAAAVLGIFAIAALLMHAQLRRMDSVPDLGDPLFSMWRMGWLFQQLRGDPRPLFDANIFHPERLTLTYSDSMLLTSLTGAPLLAAGVHPVMAYNVVFLAGFMLSALATYLLIVRVTSSPRAAFVGALIYGFHPYRFEHYSHLELQMTYWMPLALLALHQFNVRLELRYLLVAVLCAVAQLYSSMYYGVFFPIYAAAVLGTLLWLSRPAVRRLLVPVGIAAAVGLTLAVPLARPYLASREVRGDRDLGIVEFYSATSADYFRPHPRSAAHGGRLLPDVHPERALFPGAMPIALTIVALVPPIGATRLAYSAGLLLAFDMSSGMNGILYPFLYDWFPPIRGMRVPARFSIILGISLAVLAGFGVRRLLAHRRTERARTLVFAALVAAVAVDLRPILELERVWPAPPPIYATLAGRHDIVLAEFPFSTDLAGVTENVPYLYFSLWHWLPMINGYSGYMSESYKEMVEELESFPDAASLEILRARGVTHVSVNCALIVDGCAELLHAIQASPALRQVVAAGWQEKPVRLYELTRTRNNE